MRLPGVQAQDPPDRVAALQKPRALLALMSTIGFIAMALAAVRYAVTYPQSSDFAGVAATYRAQTAGLGCIYVRSVQFAGAHLVPGLAAPPVSADLAWHFNEPPLMTLVGAPFARLPLSTAVTVWEVVLWA